MLKSVHQVSAEWEKTVVQCFLDKLNSNFSKVAVIGCTKTSRTRPAVHFQHCILTSTSVHLISCYFKEMEADILGKPGTCHNLPVVKNILVDTELSIVKENFSYSCSSSTSIFCYLYLSGENRRMVVNIAEVWLYKAIINSSMLWQPFRWTMSRQVWCKAIYAILK